MAKPSIHPPPTAEKLLAIIRPQNAIAAARLDVESVLRVVVDRASALTSGVAAVIELVDGDYMVYRAASGILVGHVGLRLSRATSLSGRCVAERVALVSDDTETDPRVDREACRRVGARSMICVPLEHDGNAIGVLKVLSDVPRAFGGEDVRTLELLGDIIGASLHHARLYETTLFESQHDPLTGLRNRRAFEAHLREALRLHETHGRGFSLVLFDLDDFKLVNDRYGHAAGDEALRRFAELLRRHTRPTDAAYRLGGDDFAVVMIDTRVGAACTMARRIAAEVRSARLGNGILGVSAGAAEAQDGDGATPEAERALFARADSALYADKASHKACRSAILSSLPPCRRDRMHADDAAGS